MTSRCASAGPISTPAATCTTVSSTTCTPSWADPPHPSPGPGPGGPGPRAVVGSVAAEGVGTATAGAGGAPRALPLGLLTSRQPLVTGAVVLLAPGRCPSGGVGRHGGKGYGSGQVALGQMVGST